MDSLDVQHQLQQLQKNGLEAIQQELRKLCNRATSTTTSDVDLLAIDLFASLVKQYESIISIDALKIISEKFKSSNADEVLLSLNILEDCMSKCSAKFHSEVGKFRFLNELIRLVSPQYLGEQTPKKIRDKILDLFLLWIHCYPHEKKIKEAYDMLLKRGVQHESAKNITVPSAANKRTASNEPSNNNKKPERYASPDLSEKLRTLLQSSNASDHQAANLLIQNMVKEKERRTEVKMRRKLELKEINENADLLKEMLLQLDADRTSSGGTEVSEDVLATIRDLHGSIRRLQPTIAIIANEMNEENDLLEEALETNDLIAEVFQKYQQLVPQENEACLILNESSYATQQTHANKPNAMDELSEIFANQSNPASGGGAGSLRSTSAPNSGLLEPMLASPLDMNLNIEDPKEKVWQAVKDLNNTQYTPTVLNSANPISFQPLIATATTSSTIPPPALSTTVNRMNDIFDRLPSSSVDSTVTITAAKQEPVPASPSSTGKPVSKLANLDTELSNIITGLKFNLQKDNDLAGFSTATLNDFEDDEILEQIQTPVKSTTIPVFDDNGVGDKNEEQSNKSDGSGVVNNTMVGSNKKQSAEGEKQKSLSEIYVDLNSIRPHEKYLSRCILDDSSGLKIMLNFAKDRPRDDISVYVITTTNQNRAGISNYQFDASVSRPCKIRLQEASGHDLPGTKPFRPPTEDITQILLLTNPEHKPFKLVCIISYLIENDPDPVKESIEITDLPVSLE